MVSLNELTPELLCSNLPETLAALKDDAVWNQIPLISNLPNFDQLKEMQLVRFRGLVQDMLDPEIYLETFQTKCGETGDVKSRNGKYRDNVKLEENEEIIFDSAANVHKERRPIFAVSIPALNDWAVDLERQSVPQVENTSMESDLESAGVKRSFEETATDEETMAIDSDESQAVKKTAKGAERSAIETKGLSKEYQLNSPIVDRPSNACMIKFYDDTTKLALNQVIDAIGFVSTDPSLCGSNQKPNEFDNFDEICAMNPPPSLIPRIHAITYRLMEHLNPLLHDGRTLALTEQIKNEIFLDLRKVLSQCLLGDSLAADYLFCHLMSTVYVRCEETLGQFSLNITNFPVGILPDFTKQLYEIIELILPASHYFPITLDNLNTTEFIPSKDYETGKLTSGLLQLAPHTHLVLDETCLQPGKLESRGIESVMHISNMIRKQMLNVNFKFYNIDYNSNIPVLILSEGKSMFPSDCHVPLKCDTDAVRLFNETLVAIRQFIKPKLNLIRGYLTMLRLQDFDMNPQDMKMIQNDFVEMRRTFNATASDLHSMLILSRMMGIIQGKTMLDTECWSLAKQMEQERRHRINNLPKN